MYAVGWLFFFRSLKDRLGMRKVRYAASGAAPIAPEVLRFFMGIGVPMHEVYGMTENTAIATANRPGRDPSSAPWARCTTAPRSGSTRRPARS